MAAAEKKSSDFGEKPSLFKRFHAWWEGYELDQDIREAVRDDGLPGGDALELTEEADPDAEDAPASNWPTDPLTIAQMVWGEGFTSPGGPDYIESIVAGLGLSSESSTLEIGSGLGGGARAIAHQYGAYVTAWDTDAELAAQGTVQAKVDDLESKASVNHLDLANLKLRENFYQGALIREMLYTVKDKTALLAAIGGAVKQGTEVVITDLVAADPDAAKVWASLEPHPVYLWSPKDATAGIGAAEIGIRTAEDHSEQYVTMIVRALAPFVKQLADTRPPRAVLGPTVDYVERWGRRVAEIEAGRLAYYRFHGLAR